MQRAKQKIKGKEMDKKDKLENIEVLERERETHTAGFSEIGFSFGAKNKINIQINKRIGYKKKAKKAFFSNLSFCVP